jgi:hypothetical protein
MYDRPPRSTIKTTTTGKGKTRSRTCTAALTRPPLKPTDQLFAPATRVERERAGSQPTQRWREVDSNLRFRAVTGKPNPGTSFAERDRWFESIFFHRARGPELNTGPNWSFRDLPSATPGRPFRKSGTDGSNPGLSSAGSGRTCREAMLSTRVTRFRDDALSTAGSKPPLSGRLPGETNLRSRGDDGGAN